MRGMVGPAAWIAGPSSAEGLLLWRRGARLRPAGGSSPAMTPWKSGFRFRSVRGTLVMP